MVLPGNRDDREFEKFIEVGSEPAIMVDVVRTVGGGSTDTEYTDDSSFTVASDKGNAVGGVFTTDTIDSGDFGVFKINANRELATTVENTVDTNVTNATLAVTQSGTWNVGLNAGTNLIGKAKITDGTNDLSITAGGEMPISDNGGSITVDGTVGVTEIDTDDLDTGAGTDTQAIMGIAIPGSGGHTLWDESIKLQDGSGTSISSTANALDVNIAASAVTITADIEGDYVDDSAFTVASDKGLAVGGVFTTDTINSGDFGVFKLNADRELGVFLGEALPTGANTIGAVTQSGTWDINDISGTISLPTGAATEVTLAAVETDTGSIDTKLTTTNTKLTDIETNTDALATVTKTTVGADTGLDVNVIKGINVEVDLDAADDSVLVYGFDGSSNQKIKTDASGNVQVDIVASLPTGTNSIGDIANITNVVSVDDNGGSLTVDNSTLSVVGGGTEATAQRVTLANDSTGVLSVDDNGGSLTVDGTVAATQSGAWTISTRGTRTPYTEESTGIPQNSISWNSSTSASILTKFRLLGITCKFGGIPTANDFIVSLGSVAAPLANVTYWSVNPGTLGVTDLSWHPDGEIIIDSTIGETLNINWTNAVAQVDWGLRVVVEEVTP